MNRIGWYVFVHSLMRHLHKIVPSQWLFGKVLSVVRLHSYLWFFLKLLDNLVEICLDNIFFLRRLFKFVPVFKAVTERALFKLRLFKVVSDRFLKIYVAAVCGHIDSKVLNTSDRLLPSECLLWVVNLGLVGSHIATSWAYLELLLLVKDVFLSFSAFLGNRRSLLGREKWALGLLRIFCTKSFALVWSAGLL